MREIHTVRSCVSLPSEDIRSFSLTWMTVEVEPEESEVLPFFVKKDTKSVT